MKYFFISTVLVIFLIPSIWAQPMGMVPIEDMYSYAKFSQNQAQKKRMSKAQMVQVIQANFLKTVFLNPFFESYNKSLILENDKEDNSSFLMDNSFHTEILKDELARLLAKRDILKLKKVLLKNMDIAEKTASNKRKTAQHYTY
jgi:hypothetical protein